MGEDAWRERDAEQNGKAGGRESLMDDKERKLESVRRAEEEARSGTLGRDIGIGGSAFGGASRGNGGGGAGNGSSMRVQMPVDEDAKGALTGLQQGGLVQLVRFGHAKQQRVLFELTFHTDH